ncbi:hypothetical protein KEM55_000939 [Ascosphaera atra]|nr:hypothetical protein KEM55_000939 [Ascosphaera atra]
MEGLENSTAAWSIRDDDDANAYYAPKKFEYHEHANPWGPSDGSSAYLSDYHATTVYSTPTVKGAPSDARSARIPYERSRTGVPSDYQSVASKRTGASTKVPSVQPAGVASKMKSILKPSSTTPQGPTFLDEEAMMARHTEATKASHRSQRPERSSRSSRHRSPHSRAPSQSRTSRKDYDPYQGHSSGEETYHGAYQPVNVAPGKAYPNPKGGKGAFDYESEMTATPSNAGSRASKAQTYKSHRSHRSHRSHSRAPSMSGRSSNGRRSKLDEELRPEDSISQVC